MANFDDITIFGNTSLSDLFKQIHKNNKDIDKQIGEFIDTMKPMATSNAGSKTDGRGFKSLLPCKAGIDDR